MEISKSTVIFFSIILLTGILTMLTDLKIKKIYNDHLVIGAVLGLAAIIYTDVWAHENVLFHVVNGLVAFLAGLCCYRFGLWKGGDAKLFTLYAFLMPPLEPGHVILSSAINLFACSFIAGSIALIPVFVKDLASNDNGMFDPKNLKPPLNAIGLTVFISWVLFPVYHFAIYCFAKVLPASIISMLVTYIIFYLIRYFLKQMIKKMVRINYLIAASGIAFGFLMRLWLSPHSLSWPVLPYSILKIGLFAALSAFIYLTQDQLKEHQDRIPFAPLLFTGCVLCYTPFLTCILYLISLTRR